MTMYSCDCDKIGSHKVIHVQSRCMNDNLYMYSEYFAVVKLLLRWYHGVCTVVSSSVVPVICPHDKLFGEV